MGWRRPLALGLLVWFQGLSSPAQEKVWYVDNRASDGGNGSASSPFHRLKDAELVSRPGDTIFVHRGDGTTRGQEEGIRLKDGQKLIGQGVALTVGGEEPVLAAEPPLVSNRSGDAVVLGNDCLVEGVDIRGARGAGVSGNGVSGIRLHRLRISRITGKGVSLDSVSRVVMEEVQIEGTGGHGIHGVSVEGLALRDTEVLGSGDETGESGLHLEDPEGTIEISSSSIDGAFDRSIDIQTRRPRLQVSITGSSLSRTREGDGLFLHTLDSASFALTVTNTTFSELRGDGVNLASGSDGEDSSPGTVAVSECRFSGNQGAGIAAGSRGAGSLRITLSRNILTSQGGDGILLKSDGSSFLEATLSGNRIREVLSGRGIDLKQDEQSRLSVRVEDNTIDGTGFEGILLDGREGGEARAWISKNRVTGAGSAGDCAPLGTGHGVRIRSRKGSSTCLALVDNQSQAALPSCSGFLLSSEDDAVLRLLGDSEVEPTQEVEAQNQGTVLTWGPIEVVGESQCKFPVSR